MKRFKEAGITSEAQLAAIADSDDSFKDFQDCLDSLKFADTDRSFY